MAGALALDCALDFAFTDTRDSCSTVSDFLFPASALAAATASRAFAKKLCALLGSEGDCKTCTFLGRPMCPHRVKCGQCPVQFLKFWTKNLVILVTRVPNSTSRFRCRTNGSGPLSNGSGPLSNGSGPLSNGSDGMQFQEPFLDFKSNVASGALTGSLIHRLHWVTVQIIAV